MKSFVKQIVLLLGAALVFLACEFEYEIPGPVFVPVDSIIAVPSGGVKNFPMRLDMGVSPDNATNRTIVWTLKEDGGTDTIVSRGILSAARSGTVTLTARIQNGKTRTTDYVEDFEIRIVDEHVKVSSVTPDFSLECAEGEEVRLSGTVMPSYAANTTIVWELKDAGTTGAKISIVDSRYAFTAAKEGKAVITAVVYGGGARPDLPYTKDFTITVNPVRVTGVSFHQNEISLAVGDSDTLVPVITPANASEKSITWSSDNAAVATVNQTGKVTAVSPGTAQITVATVDGGHKAACTVTVRNIPVSIAVTKQPNKTEYWFYEELDTDGLELTLTYDVGSEVITVTPGQTTGFNSTSAGSKTVTVHYGGFTATFIVTVTARTFTVTFDNGVYANESSTPNQTVTQPEDKLASLPELTSARREFNGWNTKADGSGSAFTTASLVNNDTTDEEGELTLYADWGRYLTPVTYVEDIAPYLREQPGGANRNSPVNLPLNMNLGNMQAGSVWSTIFGQLIANKYVRLDLSQCTMTGTGFDPGSSIDGMDNVADIVLPNTAKSIVGGLFKRPFSVFLSLTKVVLPEGLTEIGDYAFDQLQTLTEINLPSTLERIGDNAFDQCRNINSQLELPSSLTYIGASAFRYCTNVRFSLARLSASTLTTIGNSAFEECTITQFTLPPALISIGEFAFSNCKFNNQSVTLPTTLKSINTFAFTDCTGITSINLPEGLETIGDGAFSFCTNTLFTLIDNKLPSTLKTIGRNAFRGCANFNEEIILPSALTSIGSAAFEDCSNLKLVTCLAVTPPTYVSLYWYDNPPFYGTHATLQILVPSGSVSAYQAADGWSVYATKISGF